jgi:hypothetical protein
MTSIEVPASVGQRLLWQMEHHRGANGALNCPVVLRFSGELDLEALDVALDALAWRHEALRTTFTGRAHRLMQVIHSQPRRLALKEIDLSGGPDAEGRLTDALARETAMPLSPEDWPVRVALWRVASDEHVVALTLHHLVTDGWSCAVIANELGVLYAKRTGDRGELPPVGLQYRDWVARQNALLAGPERQRLTEYWRRSLAGAAIAQLPRNVDRAPVAERRTAVVGVSIPRESAVAVEELARREASSTFAVALAAYLVHMRGHGAGDDVTVSTIFANRGATEAARTVGFLSNMVVLRTDLARTKSFREILRRASETVVAAVAHQELPYQMLPLDTMRLECGRPDSHVFQLFAGPMQATETSRTRIEPIVSVPEGFGSRWDFEFSLFALPDELRILVAYADDLFDRAWTRAFLDGYVDLLREIAWAADGARDAAVHAR